LIFSNPFGKVFSSASNFALLLNPNGSNVLIGSSVDSGQKLQVSGTVLFTQSGGLFSVDSNGQFISKQSLDVATAGGRFTGQSNRGSLGAIHIEQTTTGADGGYMEFRTSNSGSTTPTTKMRIKENGVINITSMPTSSVGLVSGDLWNNLGIVNIVP